MNRAVEYGTAIVLAHLMVNIIHGAAHRELHVELGSAAVLLLVVCTLNPPKEEDFGNLVNMRGILEREVFKDMDVRVVPVIFTRAAESPTYRETENGFGFVPIVNADGLDTLLALLKVGQEVRFFEFLNNPKLCELRKPFGS